MRQRNPCLHTSTQSLTLGADRVSSGTGDLRSTMMRSLFAELRRRNVIRMAGLYLVGA